MNSVIEKLKGKRVRIAYSLPMPDGSGGIGFPGIVGHLEEADDKGVLLRTDRSHQYVQFERIQYIEATSEIAVATGLQLPPVRG